MYPRLLNPLKSHSFFLIGPRGTGKSSLISTLFSENEVVKFDLLDPSLYEQLLADPSLLAKRLEPHMGRKSWVVIDEVQKVPQLLDIVHQQIFARNFKFVLSGSSARKLRRNNANLLAGRAFWYTLFPLTHRELGQDFDLHQRLQFGGLPEVVVNDHEAVKIKYLKSYSQTYLREEIVAEQIIRNIPPFRRFLEVAASTDTEPIVASNVAKDILSDHKTVLRYYSILEDTLLGFSLNPFHKSPRKRFKKAPKFYLFDCGIVRALLGTLDIPLVPKSFEYGKLFENFIVNEIRALLAYKDQQHELSYLRIDEKNEIDLIIERAGKPVYICEIKSSARVDDRHASTLNLLSSDFPDAKKILISQDPDKKQLKNVLALHWKEALDEIIG